MLGTNIAAGMILFTLLGLYLDHKRGTSPFWTVGGVLMGFSYAAYEFWTTLRLLRSQDQKKTEKAGLDGAPSPENSRELGKK
jgi:F0F1-type ATP synthase assembly protein I